MAQLSSDLPFAAFYTLLGVPVTGLTVTVTVYSETGSVLVSGAACTEIADGEYRYTLAAASVDALGYYSAHFNTAGSVDQQKLVTGELVESAASAAPTAAAIADAVWDETASDHNTSGTTGEKLNLIGAASVTISSPVAEDGDTTIRQGVDYTLTYTLSSPPSPAPSPVTFTCAALGFSKACSYNSPTITLALTAAETAAFSVGKYQFEIRGTVSAAVRLLVTGDLTVERDY